MAVKLPDMRQRKEYLHVQIESAASIYVLSLYSKTAHGIDRSARGLGVFAKLGRDFRWNSSINK